MRDKPNSSSKDADRGKEVKAGAKTDDERDSREEREEPQYLELAAFDASEGAQEGDYA